MTAVRTPHPLDQGHPPAWASEWGDDGHGVFVGFTIGGVSQRLRWIPPGRFVMGSPESEAGRLDDEGPQHEVTISRGFWLGETPCTQALWEAVTGENPSRFRSSDRPVEQVNWENCRSFLDDLNQRLPRLEARLPTEAEWEYACRAGTETSTYAGELEILGFNNAPLLDDVAWYGGNSGHDLDLAESVSSGWREQQYPHKKAATRRVRQKKPNAWGLHDMLGNVWEWCADAYGPYSAEAQQDPLNHEGSRRVLRGGSWLEPAQSVRSAVRSARTPGYRYVIRGFRLARGQGE